MISSTVDERGTGSDTRTRVGDIQTRVASALKLSPDVVNLERQEIGHSGLVVHCMGKAGRTRFFAKIFLVDSYPVPPRFAAPAEELAVPAQPRRPVAEQIATEWSMVHQICLLVGSKSVPAPLGCSVEDRTLVFEEVKGSRLDRLANRPWRCARRMRATEEAMFQAGAWLRSLHDSSLREEGTIDIAEVIGAMRVLICKRGLKTRPYAERALNALEFVRQDLHPRTSWRVPVALNHGDFSMPNLLWDDQGRRLWVLDFELSGFRPILHDLCTMIFTLRNPLLKPFNSPRGERLLEKAFWSGYGPIPEETRVFVNGLACARIFYHSLPRISTLRKRRGWTGGLKASVYKSFLQRSMIARILRIQRSDRCAGGWPRNSTPPLPTREPAPNTFRMS